VAISPNALSVVIDTLDTGFNPHLRSDLGPDTDLLSALTLPSAYDRTQDGSLRRNADLIRSVSVVSTAPFTLRYEIAPEAQWSDGVPIGAEDFRYLWRNASTFPGTVDSGGYRHIVDVRSGAGGKSVDVEFDGEYPQWRTLFSNLLPSHLMGDDVRSFARALVQGAAASGGPFAIDSVDLGIGQMVLARNDRYWGTPPQAEQIVLRQAADQGTLGQAARTSSGALVSVADTETNRLVLDTVGGFHDGSALDGDQLLLTWNTTASGTDDARVRAALGRLVDAATVGKIVSGVASEPHVSTFPLTSEVGAPPAADAAAASRELEALGYAKNGGTWSKDGKPLEITLGVVAGGESTLIAASTVVDNLRSAGVDARVWELSDESLYSGALPYGLVNGVVTWAPASGDPLAEAENRYRCVKGSDTGSGSGSDASGDSGEQPAPTTTSPGYTSAQGPQPAPATVTKLQPPSDSAGVGGVDSQAPAGALGTEAEAAESEAKAAEKSASEDSGSEITVPVPTNEAGEPVLRSSRSDNLSGICDPELDSAIDAAMQRGSANDAAMPGAADSGEARDASGNVSQVADYSADIADKVSALSIEVPLYLGDRLVSTSERFAGFDMPGAQDVGRPQGRELYESAFQWRTQ